MSRPCSPPSLDEASDDELRPAVPLPAPLDDAEVERAALAGPPQDVDDYLRRVRCVGGAHATLQARGAAAAACCAQHNQSARL